MEMLRVEGLSKKYSKRGLFGKGIEATAADCVTFSVDSGEVFVLAGESGSGKSTIAKMILYSVMPDSGSIYLEGRKAGAKEIRSRCQMIHQDPYDSINPRMRVLDIVSEPLEIMGMGKEERRARALEALAEARLGSDTSSKYPHMLSGGQRQRVVLARALAPSPRIIIADEPVSMLDVSIRAEMLELFSELQKRRGITFLYITHDLATARHFGDHIAILYRGKIVESGPIGMVLDSPRHPYTQALVDAVSEPDPKNIHRQKTIRIAENTGYESGCGFADRCPHVVEKCSIEPELEGIGGGQSTACYVNPG